MKRILTISILLFGITFTSLAQNKLVADPSAKLMKCYPTLATSNIVFEFQRTLDKSYSLQLYNFMGKRVYETRTLSQRNTLALSDFYRGIYVYQLRDRNGKIVQSGKFQVIK